MDQKTEKTYNNDNKNVHLQLLQEPIGRMSTISSIFKGFSAAILAGLASASIADINIWALMIGLLPLFSFLVLDIYYLRIEKSLRYRYNMIAKDKAKVDFMINPKLNKKEKKEAKARVMDCLKSPSIYLFYGPVLLCAIALFILKICGVF